MRLTLVVEPSCGLGLGTVGMYVGAADWNPLDARSGGAENEDAPTPKGKSVAREEAAPGSLMLAEVALGMRSTGVIWRG